MENKQAPLALGQLLFFLLIIILISTMGQFASDLYLPSLPAMSRSLSVHVNLIQLSLTVFMFGFSLSQLIYGPWSDASGRKKPLITGLSIMIIGSLICTLASSISVLYFGRLLQGLGVGAGASLGRPMVRDLVDGERLVIYGSALAISAIVILSFAPIIGGYIQHFAGWRYNFAFLVVYTLLILMLYYFVLPETSRYHHKDNLKAAVIFSNAKLLLQSPVFMRYVFCSLFTYAGILAWLTSAPIIFQESLGMTAVEFGWIYIYSGLGFIIGALLNMVFIRYYAVDRLLRFGLLIQLSAGLLMLILFCLGYFSTWSIMLPIMIFMLGSSIVFPNTSAGALSPFPKIAGTAGALLGFIQILGGALSSSIIALLHDKNQLPVAIMLITTASLSYLIFYFLSDKEKD